MNLVCYLSNSYPSQKQTLINARLMIEGGCDILEVDLPNDNPYIDGPLLQKRMIHSYEADPSLSLHMETIYKLREQHPDQKIIVLAYEKTILQIGMSSFLKLYNDNSIYALILVDNKNNQLKTELMDRGVKIVSYIRSDLPMEDIENAKTSNSFIYLQAKDDQSKHNWQEKVKTNIRTLKRVHSLDKEIYCGVGVSSPEDIQKLKELAVDGAFVGSAVFTKEHTPMKMKQFVRQLSNRK